MNKTNRGQQLLLFPPEGIPQTVLSERIRVELTNLLSQLIISVLEGSAESRGEENRKGEGHNG